MNPDAFSSSGGGGGTDSSLGLCGDLLRVGSNLVSDDFGVGGAEENSLDVRTVGGKWIGRSGRDLFGINRGMILLIEIDCELDGRLATMKRKIK